MDENIAYKKPDGKEITQAKAFGYEAGKISPKEKYVTFNKID